MPKLHDLLRNKYTAWRADVPASWQAPLQGVEPDFAGVPTSATISASIPLFPRLKADPIAGAPTGASVLRCLDRVGFSNVRVVVMGQDPYPRRRQATGRAFEQGSWVAWNAASPQDAVPASFRRIVQRLAQFRTNTNGYVASNGWSKLIADLAAGTLALAPPENLFDAWESQGAIFLNKVLTYTLPAHVTSHHGVLWRPIVRRIVERIASRPGGRVVFATWGSQPATLSATITNAAVAAGAWNTRVKIVNSGHPATSSYLSGTNQFKRINDALVSIGAAPLNW
jgi:uracil DNA glycosylase